ncbi:DNA internalization-related competence protein ComEC/Rec2 [Petrocella sp. FN5]|uniref:DNA internalization-related competence protein ComEC/Rec2 n=1 Tax=Petrocella sp. FN5 TaxID=3032002 RepID=UPI0023D9CA1F|nr:DNA internalization-related competence protein ComEC/Rec2 [Petrocella sp. FN5]MDF1616572.1 DNA internalization-related competence protein ComEC/Rec2 [Petrocella sp. FN5]
MKRPLVLMTLSGIVGILLGMGHYDVSIALVMLLVYRYRNLIKQNQYKHVFPFLGICLYSFLRVLIYNQSYEATLQYYVEGAHLEIEGRIKEARVSEQYNTYILMPIKVNGKTRQKGVRLITETVLDCGEWIVVKGEVLETRGKRNEGGFDALSYNKSRGIVGTVFTKEVDTLKKQKNNWKLKIDHLRKSHEKRLHLLLPQGEAELLSTLILGSKRMDEHVRENFEKAGLIHILSISGLHVSIIGYGLFKALNKGINNQGVSAVIAMIFLIYYCIYTGMQVSTVRATIMIGLYLIQFMVNRRYDKTTAVSFAAFGMLLLHPYQLIHVGFQLSFGAVLSIFYIEPLLKTNWMPIEKGPIAGIRLLIAVQIGIWPLLAYYFYSLPVYGFLGNLLVLPVVGILILFSILSLFVSYISMGIGTFIMGVSYWSMSYMQQITCLIGELPYNTLYIQAPNIYFIIAYYIVIALWIMGLPCKKTGVCLATLMLLSVSLYLLDLETMYMHFLDVGQGDSIVINYQNRTIMIDGGGDIKKKGDNVGMEVLLPFLRHQGIDRIDTVFITHSDFDHIYGIIEIANHIPISEVILPFVYKEKDDPLINQLLSGLDDQLTQIHYFKAGDQLSYKNMNISCLWPESIYMRDNNRNSLVLYVELKDLDVLLLGDAGILEEGAIMKGSSLLNRDVEVLKVGHHGSATSSSEIFLEKVSPTLSVISVGEKNTYGHPNDEVVKNLERFSKHVLMTKDQGAIRLRYRKGKATVQSMIKE